VTRPAALGGSLTGGDTVRCYAVVTPAITVLISTRDRAQQLESSLVTIVRALDEAPSSTELVVVDNGSTDSTQDVLRRLTKGRAHVRILAVDPPKSAALNHTLAQLSCRVVLFTDDDVHVPPSWVGDMSRPILEGTADVVAGGIRLAPHLDRPWITAEFRVYLAEFTPVGPATAMFGASMATSLEAAQAIGFDENLGPGSARGLGEDILFSERLKAAGYRVMASAGPPAVHFLDPDRLTRDAMLGMAARNGASSAYLWHHWLHTDLRALRLRLARDTARLHAERRRRRTNDIVMTWREFHLAYRTAFFRSLIVERRFPPAYQRPLREDSVVRP
jgi:glycosyltransferase involved in cell wall biosynthesis